MSCFLSALLFRLLSVWSIIQFRMSIFYTSRHFPLCSSSEKRALCDNSLVYSTSLVCNNYLGSNNCSVENNFHFYKWMSCFLLLFNLDYCLYEALSSLECCLTLHVIFPLVPIQKYRAFCDNSLVYSTSLVCNNYLCQTSVLLIITFISPVKVLFPIALQFRLLSVWNIIQLRMSIFALHFFSR